MQNPLVHWMSLRRFPVNLILRFICTLALSYRTGTIVSYYETRAVFLAAVITTIVCLAITVFSLQTNVDFTSLSGVLGIINMVRFITGIITAIVFSFLYDNWLHMVYAAIGAIVFSLDNWLHIVYAAIGAIVYSLFLALNTQLLMGNRSQSLSPEEYVYGALSLYTSIMQIFLFMLQITGSRN